jgi:hypothetical protein
MKVSSGVAGLPSPCGALLEGARDWPVDLDAHLAHDPEETQRPRDPHAQAQRRTRTGPKTHEPKDARAQRRTGSKTHRPKGTEAGADPRPDLWSGRQWTSADDCDGREDKRFRYRHDLPLLLIRRWRVGWYSRFLCAARSTMREIAREMATAIMLRVGGGGSS